MPVSDLASGVTLVGTYETKLLWAGEAPITTNHYTLTIDVVKYQVVSINAADQIVAFDATLPKAAVASQPALAGDTIAFFDGGFFNHDALVWPAALDTFPERRAAIPAGTLKIGTIL
jgi:hypothetical protein